MRGRVLCVLLAACVAQSLVLPCHVAWASLDGTLQEGAYPGSNLYDGGETTEDASASNLAVPEPEEGTIPPKEYYDAVLEWFITWLHRNGVDTSAFKVEFQDAPHAAAWSRLEIKLVAARNLTEGEALFQPYNKRPEIKLVAARNLTEDEVLFQLPLALQLRSTMVAIQSKAVSEYVTTRVPGWASYSLIASWLLTERGADTKSPWAPYIRLLPSHVPLPFMYPDVLVQELQFEADIQLAKGYRTLIEKAFEVCVEAGAVGKDTTQDDFFWAISMVMSRVFQLPVDHTGTLTAPGEALLPLADLMNHASDHVIDSRLELDGTYSFYANRNITVGQELTDTYGKKGTDSFLAGYGFVLEPNEHDCFRLLNRTKGALELYNYFYPEDKTLHSEEEINWALYLAAKADATATAIAEAYREQHADQLTGPRFVMLPEDLSVWAGAVVDPPLLAGLSAIVYYFSFGSELDYSRIGHMSTWYGWFLYSADCVELSQHANLTQNELSAFESAVSAVKIYIESLFSALPTTMEEDAHIVSALEMCREGGDPVEKDEEMRNYCEIATAGGIRLQDRISAVKARLARKRLLSQVADRIGTSCQYSGDEGSKQVPEDLGGGSSGGAPGGAHASDGKGSGKGNDRKDPPFRGPPGTKGRASEGAKGGHGAPRGEAKQDSAAQKGKGASPAREGEAQGHGQGEGAAHTRGGAHLKDEGDDGGEKKKTWW